MSRSGSSNASGSAPPPVGDACMALDAKEAADGWEAFPDGESAAASYKDDVKERLQAQQRAAVPAHDLAAWTAAGPVLLAHQRAGARAGRGAAAAAADAEILALEPPLWLPDSQASACGSCHLSFRPLTRLKHHCRMCGKIFCHACCHKRLLLPPKFPLREPQRCCELCSSLLLPLQPYLAGTQSASVQPPVHDSIDPVSLRSWLNSPWSSTLEGDIYKGANILHTFTRALRLSPEAALPAAVLSGARALVLLSAAKLSAGWSASVGTGVMVSRDPVSGEWSAPCAVALMGLGWGFQLGGELADLMLVLRSEQQLRACCAGTQLGVGGNMGLAVGPVGRHADAAVMVGASGASAPVFSYSCSKGAFVGVSVESSALMVRSGVNEKFYGYSATPQQLLLQPGLVPPPQAASTLYDALHVLVQKYEVHTPLTPQQLQQRLESEKEEEAAAAAAAAAAVAAFTDRPSGATGEALDAAVPSGVADSTSGNTSVWDSRVDGVGKSIATGDAVVGHAQRAADLCAAAPAADSGAEAGADGSSVGDVATFADSNADAIISNATAPHAAQPADSCSDNSDATDIDGASVHNATDAGGGDCSSDSDGAGYESSTEVDGGGCGDAVGARVSPPARASDGHVGGDDGASDSAEEVVLEEPSCTYGEGADGDDSDALDIFGGGWLPFETSSTQKVHASRGVSAPLPAPQPQVLPVAAPKSMSQPEAGIAGGAGGGVRGRGRGKVARAAAKRAAKGVARGSAAAASGSGSRWQQDDEDIPYGLFFDD